jgi:hypothetical protein
MKDTTKQEAMDKVKHMFDKFDVDNDDHLAIVIMYDKKLGDFRMLTLNTSPGSAVAMLDNAMESVMGHIKDAIEDMHKDRILN